MYTRLTTTIHSGHGRPLVFNRHSIDQGPSDQVKDKVERLWARMTFEVTLMTTRMNWLVVMQAFLFNAYFLGTGRIRESALLTEILVPMIPIIGLVMCRITRTYVLAAVKIVDVCRSELAEIKHRFPSDFQDRVDSDINLTPLRSKAIAASYTLISIFQGFWALGLLFSILLIFHVASEGKWPGDSSIDLSIFGRLFEPSPIAVEIVTPREFYPRGR